MLHAFMNRAEALISRANENTLNGHINGRDQTNKRSRRTRSNGFAKEYQDETTSASTRVQGVADSRDKIGTFYLFNTNPIFIHFSLSCSYA